MDLKTKVAEEQGIPPDQQRLVYQGKNLYEMLVLSVCLPFSSSLLLSVVGTVVAAAADADFFATSPIC